MKATLILVIAVVMIAACMTARRRPAFVGMESLGVAVASHRSLDYEIQDFQRLVETSLTYRTRMLKVARDLSEKADAPLSGRDLEVMRSGTRAYLDLRSSLYETAYRYEGAVDDERYDDSAVRLKAVSVSLAAALVLYDNYLSAIVIFEQDQRLRRLINDPDSGFGIDADTLAELAGAAGSIQTRQRMRSVMTFVEAERKRLTGTSDGAMLEEDEAFQYISMLIDQSPSYAYVRNLQIGAVSGHRLQLFAAVSTDFVADVRDDGVNLVSLIFGNAMGLYESRKGKLYDNTLVAADVVKTLRPLDILLEKTPFRLTDNFIPGHFGHVAIWLGSEGELRELGVWDDPVVQPHHDRLRALDSANPHSGALVVEALRDGVQLNTLAHFMNVDDVAIIRPTAVQADPEAMKEALLLAFRQIGKAYDFNFDVNTTEKIVCSELAYVTFPSVRWPTENTLGRDTISPDQVARLAWENDDLDLMLFYHDGKKVPLATAVEKAKTLVEGR